jgi:hypothetical protein
MTTEIIKTIDEITDKIELLKKLIFSDNSDVFKSEKIKEELKLRKDKYLDELRDLQMKRCECKSLLFRVMMNNPEFLKVLHQ